MNKLLSFSAISLSLIAIVMSASMLNKFNNAGEVIKQSEVHFDAYIEQATVHAENVFQLSNKVEELYLEVEHLHELNIEIGDNLNARIDEIATGVDAIKDDAVAAATAASEAAAKRAEAAAEASKGYYNAVVEWFSKLPDIDIPEFTFPWDK